MCDALRLRPITEESWWKEGVRGGRWGVWCRSGTGQRRIMSGGMLEERGQREREEM